MISDQEIDAKAKEFQLRPLDVQKDYVYGWLLKGIFQRPALASQLVLKGGNALRKGYLLDTRFSKDLDFSARQAITQTVLEAELREVCSFVEGQTGVKFLDKLIVRDKDLAIPDIEALEARLYFKSFYGEENLSLRTQLDITQFDKIYLPVQDRQLLHPYSDGEACTATIKCQKLEEVLASKLTTLLHRRNPVDLFDLLYAIVFRDQFGVSRREVVTTFLKKSIFEANPTDARDQLRAVPIANFRGLWTSLVAPVASLFNFDFVATNFQGLVDSLFALIIVPQPAFSGGGGGALAPRILRPSGGIERSISGGFRNYFSSDVRNTIISAGRSGTMVQLSYDGYDRLIEPYKLEYYVRKKDGQGLEYFWGWDTSGGKSGKTGIKQFICDKIVSVHSTNRQFQPRFAVEF
ncbi:nucleotidyl transferase AbiEii/AbiGii toxin family protein [Bradyrhizobium sp. 26S5]|uniref:nucleotidyl transferase AbiEii/AbiGii toxin family protein n=1 Tax=Bradyrhizobium sp. 26S5 TaxID=3139729 RepID=UPI0030D22B02